MRLDEPIYDRKFGTKLKSEQVEVTPNPGDTLRIVASNLILDNSALKSASTQSSDKKQTDHVGNPSGDHRERKYRSTFERIRREIHQEFDRLSKARIEECSKKDRLHIVAVMATMK